MKGGEVDIDSFTYSNPRSLKGPGRGGEVFLHENCLLRVSEPGAIAVGGDLLFNFIELTHSLTYLHLLRSLHQTLPIPL